MFGNFRRFLGRYTGFALLLAAVFIGVQGGLLAGSVFSESESNFFQDDSFVQIFPTLPNSVLDFDDDSNESCCAKDYPPQLQKHAVIQTNHDVSAFQSENPEYKEKSPPPVVMTCDRFAELPEMVANRSSAPDWESMLAAANSHDVASSTYNGSVKAHAVFKTETAPGKKTAHFHISAIGGESLAKLQDVEQYSLCMARGNNVAMIANTDNGSVASYNGNDHIYLAGNNTNMMTRTGAGDDRVEIFQAQPQLASAAHREQIWSANHVYKTAVSGGEGVDTLVVNNTPVGTKWCFIGGYSLLGEYYYVIEFALPPSVTEGPRRQRINIGRSVEFVMFKGRKYSLGEFLVHGAPVDEMASIGEF